MNTLHPNFEIASALTLEAVADAKSNAEQRLLQALWHAIELMRDLRTENTALAARVNLLGRQLEALGQRAEV